MLRCSSGRGFAPRGCAHPATPWLALLLLVLHQPYVARAETGNSEVGVRASVLHAGDSVTDAMVGAGIRWRYHVADDWFVVFSLDSYRYDLVDPYAHVPARTVVFATALGKRRRDLDRGIDWFWDAGIGLGVSAVSGLTGEQANGRRYDLHVETGVGIHLGVSAGAAFAFSPHWSIVAAGRVEHQFVDMQIIERVSGESRSVDKLSPLGLSLSLNYRF
ncbi:MAG: outer membrane beta-barrel protein [Gammaproteobacteria bacterium]|nr:outer membrane beta-barrel protein [Gammaproteobacteria bacterium]